MNKPTQSELGLTIDVLRWLADHTEKHEPYAVNTIAAFREAADNVPEAEDLNDD